MVSSPRSRSLSAVRDAPVAPGSPPVVVEDVNDDLPEGVQGERASRRRGGGGPRRARRHPRQDQSPRVPRVRVQRVRYPPPPTRAGFTPPSASSKSVSPTHVPGGFVPNVLEELLGAPLPAPRWAAASASAASPPLPGRPERREPARRALANLPGRHHAAVRDPPRLPGAPPSTRTRQTRRPASRRDDFLAEFAELR